MPKLETTMGDALFAVDTGFQTLSVTKQWQDTTHFHVDSEIHILLNGNAVVEVNGKDVHINAGDVCLLAPNSSHYPKTCSDTLEKTNFSFRLLPNYAYSRSGKRFSEYVYYSNIFKSVQEYFIINDAELLSIVQKLIGEPYESENEHIYQTLLAVFFITLAKRIKEHHPPYKELTVRGESEGENSFRQRKCVEEFFQKRYNEDISIEDLAKELCVSVSHAHRIVKKVFDGGFQKTLMKQRMEHACMLIKQRELTLTEIAYCCGYTSYNGFLSAFKNYMGKTPREYEKSLH